MRSDLRRNVLRNLVGFACLLICAASELRADNYDITPFTATFSSPRSMSETWVLRWVHEDGSVDSGGNYTVNSGTSYTLNFTSWVVHFAGRLEVGYWADGFQPLAWYQNHLVGEPDPSPKHGGFDSSGAAVDGSGSPVDGSGNPIAPPAPKLYKAEFDVTNTGDKPRTYNVHVTMDDGSLGPADSYFALEPGESTHIKLENSKGFSYQVSHLEELPLDAATGGFAAGGASAVVDATGHSTGDETATEAPTSPTVSGSTPTTAPQAPLPAAGTSSGSGGTSPATGGDTKAAADSVGAKVDRGTEQARLNGDTAHKDANNILDALNTKGSGAATGVSAGSGLAGFATAVSNIPSNLAAIKGDLTSLASGLLPQGGNTQQSLNFTMRIINSDVTIRLDDWIPYNLIRGLFMILICYGTYRQLVRITRGMLADGA